jgi:hypothetical protein
MIDVFVQVRLLHRILGSQPDTPECSIPFVPVCSALCISIPNNIYLNTHEVTVCEVSNLTPILSAGACEDQSI